MPLARAVRMYSSCRIWETVLFISMKSPDVRNRIKMHSGRIMCWTMLAVRAAPERPGETMPLIGTHLSL